MCSVPLNWKFCMNKLTLLVRSVQRWLVLATRIKGYSCDVRGHRSCPPLLSADLSTLALGPSSVCARCAPCAGMRSWRWHTATTTRPQGKVGPRPPTGIRGSCRSTRLARHPGCSETVRRPLPDPHGSTPPPDNCTRGYHHRPHHLRHTAQELCTTDQPGIQTAYCWCQSSSQHVSVEAKRFYSFINTWNCLAVCLFRHPSLAP